MQRGGFKVLRSVRVVETTGYDNRSSNQYALQVYDSSTGRARQIDVVGDLSALEGQIIYYNSRTGELLVREPDFFQNQPSDLRRRRINTEDEPSVRSNQSYSFRPPYSGSSILESQTELKLDPQSQHYRQYQQISAHASHPLVETGQPIEHVSKPTGSGISLNVNTSPDVKLPDDHGSESPNQNCGVDSSLLNKLNDNTADIIQVAVPVADKVVTAVQAGVIAGTKVSNTGISGMIVEGTKAAIQSSNIPEIPSSNHSDTTMPLTSQIRPVQDDSGRELIEDELPDTSSSGPIDVDSYDANKQKKQDVDQYSPDNWSANIAKRVQFDDFDPDSDPDPDPNFNSSRSDKRKHELTGDEQLVQVKRALQKAIDGHNLKSKAYSIGNKLFLVILCVTDALIGTMAASLPYFEIQAFGFLALAFSFIIIIMRVCYEIFGIGKMGIVHKQISVQLKHKLNEVTIDESELLSDYEKKTYVNAVWQELNQMNLVVYSESYGASDGLGSEFSIINGPPRSSKSSIINKSNNSSLQQSSPSDVGGHKYSEQIV